MKLRPFAGFPCDCPVIGEPEDPFPAYGSSQRPPTQYPSQSSHNVNRKAIFCVILSGPSRTGVARAPPRSPCPSRPCLDVGVKEYGRPMRIGELAERAGTSTRTLRYYESRGLLPARRDGNGHRTYDEDDLRLLRQIRMLQDFGFELEETRPFVDCLRAGHPAGDSCPASLAVYRRKLVELDGLIGRLTDVRDQLGRQLADAELAAGVAAVPKCEMTG